MWDAVEDQNEVKFLLYTDLQSLLTKKNNREVASTLSPRDYKQAYIMRALLSQFTE